MYNGTVEYEDTRIYHRYQVLSVAADAADSFSLRKVGAVVFDAWIGKTIESRDGRAGDFHGDALAWRGPSPFVTGVSSTYHLIKASDESQNPQTRIISSVPLDSIRFFHRDSAATEKCDEYFPAILAAALKPYDNNLLVIPSAPEDHLISSLQEMESNAFEGSVYDWPALRSLHSKTTGKYFMIVTLYNVQNRYWTANSKAHHILKLNLYIVDKDTGRIVTIKFLELLIHLDMRPMEAYPTADSFRKSKMHKFYSLAIKKLLFETKNQSGGNERIADQ